MLPGRSDLRHRPARVRGRLQGGGGDEEVADEVSGGDAGDRAGREDDRRAGSDAREHGPRAF